MINSLPEAISEVESIAMRMRAVDEFMERFTGLLNQFNAVSGVVAPAQAVVRQSNGTSDNETAEPAIGAAAVTDRVMLIFREASVPLKPRDAAAEYARRGWTDSAKEAQKSIQGTILYLAKKKRLLVKTPRGYVVAQPDLSAVNGHERGAAT